MSRRSRRAAAVLRVGLLACACAAATASCTQETQNEPMRSLEQSGRAAFLCLAPPAPPCESPSCESPSPPGRSLDACDDHIADDPSSFTDESGATRPHLYALVTQTRRGEIAVVDVTADNEAVLDQDVGVPGRNFLPIGAQPIDVVTTPGGTAAFVGVADVGREGLFALPSTMLRPADRDSNDPVPTLTSWPACSLPSAPGSMLVMGDPPNDDSKVRASCDGEYGINGDQGENEEEGSPRGDLTAEGEGRQKLVVALPEEGGFAVIDAQRLLDRVPGSFDPCPIERWVPLATDVPAPPPAGEPSTGAACVSPAPPAPGQASSYRSRPAGFALSSELGRLYIADLEAPVIHVVDLPTPCEPRERAPLLPTSLEDPARVVTTTRVAVSPRPTPELKRFLYALDALDGSAMVFDVSDAPTPSTPLLRPHPEYDPFEPADRVRFASPARDVVLFERDVPAAHPATGVAPSGTRCDPDPSLEVCTEESLTCDVGTLYRTPPKLESGAGPRKLRGVFAFLLLTTGTVAVLDVDDYDAACRGPHRPDELYGCEPGSAGASDQPLVTSGESSCNVVLPHTPRSAFYSVTSDTVGRHEPGLQAYPLLYNSQGTLVPTNDPTTPYLRAVLPDADAPAMRVVIGSEVHSSDIDASTGLITDANGLRHTLLMNVEDPRSNVIDQGWVVTYEGALPGFTGKRATLSVVDDDAKALRLVDANSRFCDAGVQSLDAVTGVVSAAGVDDDPDALADRLQIAEELAPKEDSYWASAACTYKSCETTFGVAASPSICRDVVIREAYQDRLDLALLQPKNQAGEDSCPSDAASVRCCFPTDIAFNVRGGAQWIVLGEANGFLHHTIADPATGACRSSCDAAAQRKSGRVYPAPAGAPIGAGSFYAFLNPMFRFGISGGASKRGDRFSFITQGAFVPLTVSLRGNAPNVQPQAITFVPPTGELAVTDGSLEGLLMISTDSIGVSKQFY